MALKMSLIAISVMGCSASLLVRVLGNRGISSEYSLGIQLVLPLKVRCVGIYSWRSHKPLAARVLTILERPCPQAADIYNLSGMPRVFTYLSSRIRDVFNLQVLSDNGLPEAEYQPEASAGDPNVDVESGALDPGLMSHSNSPFAITADEHATETSHRASSTSGTPIGVRSSYAAARDGPSDLAFNSDSETPSPEEASRPKKSDLLDDRFKLMYLDTAPESSYYFPESGYTEKTLDALIAAAPAQQVRLILAEDDATWQNGMAKVTINSGLARYPRVSFLEDRHILWDSLTLPRFTQFLHFPSSSSNATDKFFAFEDFCLGGETGYGLQIGKIFFTWLRVEVDRVVGKQTKKMPSFSGLFF